MTACATQPPVQDSAVASFTPARLEPRADPRGERRQRVRHLASSQQPLRRPRARAAYRTPRHVVEHDAEAALDRALEVADRRRLGDVEEAERDERDRLPAEPGGVNSSTARKATTSSQFMPPWSAAAEIAAGRGRRPTRRWRRGPRSRRPASSGESHPASTAYSGNASSVPTVPGASGASPVPNPSAMKCAGCESRKPALGRTSAWPASSEVVEPAPGDRERLARGIEQAHPRRSPPTMRRCASPRRPRRAPAASTSARRAAGAVNTSS